MTVTRAQIDTYRADGVVLLPGAFVAWLDGLNAAFDRLIGQVAAGGPPPRDRPETRDDAALGDMTGDLDVATGRAHLRNAVPHDPRLWSWATESPAAAIVGTLTGSTAVQLWYDLWFCKLPSAAPAEGATPWHHDATGHPFVGAAMPSLWIALGDVGPDDAPLQTLRGSHRDSRLFRPPVATGKEGVVPPAGYAPLEAMLAEVAARPDAIDTWTCRAGDALLIHPMTWHASLPQRAVGRRRLAMSSRWIGDDLRYDPGPYSFPGFHAGVRSLAPGAIPPVDFLPRLWERAP